MSLIRRVKNLLQIKQDIYDVLFYASHHVDELWIRSTALQCKKNGHKITFVCGNVIPAHIQDIYRKHGISFHENCDGKNLKRICAKLAVTASTGLDKKIFNKSLSALIHMPHSISSLHMIYPDDAFDGYDYLFSVGPHHDAEMEKIARKRNLSNFRKIYPTGYGKLDILKEQRASCPSISKERPLILIAPSWGRQNILDTMGIELCLHLLNEGYRVIVRPHPMFFIENAPFLDEADKNLSHHPDFSLEKSTDVGNAIFYADILITDYSGIAQEFSALNERPVIFVDVPKKILNAGWEEYEQIPIELKSRGILGPIVQTNAEDTIAAVKSTIDHAEIWTKNALLFKSEYLHPENCPTTAAMYIKELLDGAYDNG